MEKCWVTDSASHLFVVLPWRVLLTDDILRLPKVPFIVKARFVSEKAEYVL